MSTKQQRGEGYDARLFLEGTRKLVENFQKRKRGISMNNNNNNNSWKVGASAEFLENWRSLFRAISIYDSHYFLERERLINYTPMC